ncbi:MAG TPA: DoxX family protein [Chitinophagales bacterium]|nr:DoxX family protein [Chitinophagales bacterium]
MSAKTKRIIWITLMALPLAMITMSGFMKITGNKEIVDGLSKIGFGPYITFMGILELISVALFIFPRTYKIGFLVLTAFLGGAISTELASGRPPMAAIFLTLIWISVFIRNSEMFLTSKRSSDRGVSGLVNNSMKEMELQGAS